LNDANIKARLEDLGATPLAMLPTEFGNSVKNETEKWGRVVKFANVRAE
jgi:hypothetical protein